MRGRPEQAGYGVQQHVRGVGGALGRKALMDLVRDGVKKAKKSRYPHPPGDGPSRSQPHPQEPGRQPAQHKILRHMGRLAHEKFDKAGRAQFSYADFRASVGKADPCEKPFHKAARHVLPDQGLEVLPFIRLRRHEENESHPQKKRQTVKPEDFPTGFALLSHLLHLRDPFPSLRASFVSFRLQPDPSSASFSCRSNQSQSAPTCSGLWASEPYTNSIPSRRQARMNHSGT